MTSLQHVFLKMEPLAPDPMRTSVQYLPRFSCWSIAVYLRLVNASDVIPCLHIHLPDRNKPNNFCLVDKKSQGNSRRARFLVVVQSVLNNLMESLELQPVICYLLFESGFDRGGS